MIYLLFVATGCLHVDFAKISQSFCLLEIPILHVLANWLNPAYLSPRYFETENSTDIFLLL